jgi:hypothetical protein
MEMDDILKAKLIFRENIKEENEKLREEGEKEIFLNERMSLNSVRNLSLIDRSRLKLLKQNINLSKIKLNENKSKRESIKKENEILYTIQNIPNNNISSLKNEEDEDENIYEKFLRDKVAKFKKERDDNLKIVEKTRKEMHKSFNKDYIENLWKKNKKSKNPSFNILSSLFTDLTKITIKERKKLKAFKEKKELILPPILMHKFHKPLKKNGKNNNSNILNKRNNGAFNFFSQISIDSKNNNNKVDKSTQI